jgi:hypothetical protein
MSRCENCSTSSATTSGPRLKHVQQPFTYGSPPGREDFYFVAGT